MGRRRSSPPSSRVLERRFTTARPSPSPRRSASSNHATRARKTGSLARRSAPARNPERRVSARSRARPEPRKSRSSLAARRRRRSRFGSTRQAFRRPAAPSRSSLSYQTSAATGCRAHRSSSRPTTDRSASSSGLTDQNGEARTTLTTSRQTIVRASVADKSGEATVQVVNLPTVSISVASGTTPLVGQPVTFTVTPTTPAGTSNPIQNVVVDFGDGTPTVSPRRDLRGDPRLALLQPGGHLHGDRHRDRHGRSAQHDVDRRRGAASGRHCVGDSVDNDRSGWHGDHVHRLGHEQQQRADSAGAAELRRRHAATSH